jgi:hypothetical protein
MKVTMAEDNTIKLVDDFGQKGIKWADARKALEDVNNWGEDIPILEERFIGNTNDKITLEIIPPEGNIEGLIPSEDYRLQASILRENGDIEIIKTYNNPRQFGADGKNFFNDISSIDTPTNVVDDIKLSGTMGGNTTPTGVNIAYANVEDIEKFIQFDRKAEGNLERINNIKKTILDKGYLYDTAYEGGVVFGVIVDEAGNVQIPEGNHRLQALIDVAKETGQKIYVPINPMLTSTGDGNKVQLTNSDNAYNSMKQLLTDMLEGNKNFNVERTISEKLGEPGTRIIGLDSYTYPGGAPGTSTTQSNIKKFFNSIGINAITYDELPDNSIYKTGVNTFTDTPTNVVDDVVMNKSEAIDNVNNLVDELPLEDAFKKQVKKNTARISKNVATPGGVIDFIDVWELGVLALAVAAISTNEVDEIPTIIYNQGVKMYNSMLSSVGIPGQVQEKPYNINFEKAIKTFNIAEMFMPTAYAEKAAVKEFKKGQEAGVDISVGLGAGAGVPPMQFKGQEPKQDNGDINNIMVNLMKNISNAQKSYPITSSEMSNFSRNPIQVVAQDTADKPVKIEYDSKEKQKINDIYAKLYKNLSNAGARVQ